MTGGQTPGGSVTISNGTVECTEPIEQGYCDLTWSVSGITPQTITDCGEAYSKGSEIKGIEIDQQITR